jgi:hypothetical protein
MSTNQLEKSAVLQGPHAVEQNDGISNEKTTAIGHYFLAFCKLEGG